MRDELRAEVEKLEVQVQSDDDSIKLHFPVQSGIAEELMNEVVATDKLRNILKSMLDEKKRKEGKGEKAEDVDKDDGVKKDGENKEGDDHDEEEGKEKGKK